METKWELKEFSVSNIINKGNRRQDSRWRTPPTGWIKLKFDGASKGNPGMVGYGAILGNESRRMLPAVMGAMGKATNNEVELHSLDEGMNMCVEKGFLKILIEGDSQVVINGVMQSNFCSWKLKTWLSMIEEKLNKIIEF